MGVTSLAVVTLFHSQQEDSSLNTLSSILAKVEASEWHIETVSSYPWSEILRWGFKST